MTAFTELNLVFSTKLAVPTAQVAKLPPTLICDAIEKTLRDYLANKALTTDSRVDIFYPQPGVQPGGIEIHPAD